MPVSSKGTAYDLDGPRGAPVVVLIHGLGMSRGSTFGAIGPVLAKKFRVLSYDLCGHGETVLPQRTPSLTILSEQLISLMDELNIERAALVGFSLGGMINRRCAMDHPSRVSALCILNSPHEREAQQQRLVEKHARDAGTDGPGATIEAALERWFTTEFRRDHEDQVNAIRKVVMANHPENYAQHRFTLAAGVVELIRPDPPIIHPTLVMTCENDSGSTPAMSHEIASEIVGAEVMIVPRLRHLGLVEKPMFFLEAMMKFLDRVT